MEVSPKNSTSPCHQRCPLLETQRAGTRSSAPGRCRGSGHTSKHEIPSPAAIRLEQEASARQSSGTRAGQPAGRVEAAAPAEITSRCLSRHFLISRISLVYTRRELIAQVKQWKKVSLLLPAKLQPGVPAPVSARQHPAEEQHEEHTAGEGWILEEVLRNSTKPARHRPTALRQARTPLRWQGPSSVLPGGSPEAGQGPVRWLQIKAQELAGRSTAATQHTGSSARGCHPRHGPVPNPHTVPKEGMSPGHLWASWVPCRGSKMHPTGPETQGQAQGWPRPWPRLPPAPSQAPQHKQHPRGAELTKGQGGEAGTVGTAPAHP